MFRCFPFFPGNHLFFPCVFPCALFPRFQKGSPFNFQVQEQPVTGSHLNLSGHRTGSGCLGVSGAPGLWCEISVGGVGGNEPKGPRSPKKDRNRGLPCLCCFQSPSIFSAFRVFESGVGWIHRRAMPSWVRRARHYAARLGKEQFFVIGEIDTEQGVQASPHQVRRFGRAAKRHPFLGHRKRRVLKSRELEGSQPAAVQELPGVLVRDMVDMTVIRVPC